ncbi:hypothetical protein [Novosphingobium aquimarinum]|uniref:hypothetical protein n=1 Tax=Novosphingobium aquimarinum TaxID=2682494 RepID=UPI0018DE2008|nr:hypothetical protein [Novosphingobium aquimarinum]
MMRIKATIATLLALAPGVLHAAEPVCISPREFSSLAAYALPSVITGTGKRCATQLGPDAYLRTNGAALASKYATRKAANWPGAKSAFLKMGAKDATANQLFASLPDESLRQIVDPLLEGMVIQEIPIEKCTTIDSVVRLLAPLPPENTAELIALTAGLVGRGTDAKVGQFKLCET